MFDSCGKMRITSKINPQKKKNWEMKAEKQVNAKMERIVNPAYQASVRRLEKVVIFGQERARIKRIWKRNNCNTLRVRENLINRRNDMEKPEGDGGGEAKKERPAKWVKGKGGKAMWCRKRREGIRMRFHNCWATRGILTPQFLNYFQRTGLKLKCINYFSLKYIYRFLCSRNLTPL